MKTIFHANIDGFEVVLGFGEAFGLIDPVATNIKIAPLLQACPEQQQMSVLNQSIGARRQEAAQAFSLADAARVRGDGATMTRENANYAAKLQEIAELEKQLPERIRAFEVARSAIVDANAVYTHPPQGEDLIDDVQAGTLQTAHALRGDGQQLLMTGEYVRDLRGRDFYLAGPPWAHKVIDKLGEDMPAGAIVPDQLTDAQRQEIADEAEAARVAALTPEQAQAEADAKSAAILAQAAQMRSELEIQGDAQALAKSQAWYKAQTATAVSGASVTK